MIRSLDDIPQLILDEQLDVAVVSYGGCSSNSVCHALTQNGFRCYSKTYNEILCHCPEPIYQLSIPIIYIYRDPRCALLSMKRRGKGIYDVNQQKLSNRRGLPSYSDRQLLYLMCKQFYKWVVYSDPTKFQSPFMVLSYKDLFLPNITHTLCRFLKRTTLTHFPLTYQRPHITESFFSDGETHPWKYLFTCFQNPIHFILNFSVSPIYENNAEDNSTCSMDEH